MNSSSLRYLLLKSYFPAAFLIAIVLAILDATMPPVAAQVKTATVTVYVTLVQTVPIYMPVTAYVTVASVATLFMTFTSTAVSVSLDTVTLWNTLTSISTARGILGALPNTVFGSYSDAGIMGIGAVAGATLTAAITKISGSRVRTPTHAPPLPGMYGTDGADEMPVRLLISPHTDMASVGDSKDASDTMHPASDGSDDDASDPLHRASGNSGGGNVFARAIETLNEIDEGNLQTLEKVIDASKNSTGGTSDVAFDGEGLARAHREGEIRLVGRREAELAGTGGVALVENAKDTAQTLTSNVSPIDANSARLQKTAERKMETEDDAGDKGQKEDTDGKKRRKP